MFEFKLGVIDYSVYCYDAHVHVHTNEEKSRPKGCADASRVVAGLRPQRKRLHTFRKYPARCKERSYELAVL